MRRSRTVLLAAIALGSLASFSASSAAPPVGSCPPGFHLHSLAHDHDGHLHKHVGNSFDQNGDGRVCVKHVSQDGSIHVHMDNVLRK